MLERRGRQCDARSSRRTGDRQEQDASAPVRLDGGERRIEVVGGSRRDRLRACTPSDRGAASSLACGRAADRGIRRGRRHVREPRAQPPRRSSSRLASIRRQEADQPVMLPPGRARLGTSPRPTGSSLTLDHDDGDRLGLPVWRPAAAALDPPQGSRRRWPDQGSAASCWAAFGRCPLTPPESMTRFCALDVAQARAALSKTSVVAGRGPHPAGQYAEP